MSISHSNLVCRSANPFCFRPVAPIAGAYFCARFVTKQTVGKPLAAVIVAAKRSLALVPSLILVLMVSACALGNNDSIFRKFNVDDEKGKLTSVLIDAKQRAIITKRRNAVDSQGKLVEGYSGTVTVCAEPSPDVFTAISQSFGASGSFSGTSKEAQLALSYALAESAGELRRARTIQLLRDSLFNTCLGYMNGALASAEYSKLLNKYADETLTLLAVEQITPQAATAPLTLGSEGISNESKNNQNQSGSGNQNQSGSGNQNQSGSGNQNQSGSGNQNQSDSGSQNQTSNDNQDQQAVTKAQATAAADEKLAKEAADAKTKADAAFADAEKDVATKAAAVKASPNDASLGDALNTAKANDEKLKAQAAAADKKATTAAANATKSAAAEKAAASKLAQDKSAQAAKPNSANSNSPSALNAPYPTNNSIQTLAPPTNAAVVGVQDMVHTFLLETLVNRCLDNLSDTAAANPLAAAGVSADQLNYSVYVRNYFCRTLLDAYTSSTLSAASNASTLSTAASSSGKSAGATSASGSSSNANYPPPPDKSVPPQGTTAPPQAPPHN